LHSSKKPAILNFSGGGLTLEVVEGMLLSNSEFMSIFSEIVEG
jgi:hypothetical protein